MGIQVLIQQAGPLPIKVAFNAPKRCTNVFVG
jgi:hypothetical protein